MWSMYRMQKTKCKTMAGKTTRGHKKHTNGKFITLTFSDKGFKKIWEDDLEYEKKLNWE